MRLWRLFQIWRGMRMLERSDQLAFKAMQLRYEAGRLIGQHAKAPQQPNRGTTDHAARPADDT